MSKSIFSDPRADSQISQWAREVRKGPAERAAEEMADALAYFAEIEITDLSKLQDRQVVMSIDPKALLKARTALESWRSTHADGL